MEKLKILLMTMLPLLAGACRSIGGKAEIDTPSPEPVPVVKQDSTLIEGRLIALADYPIRSLDIFIYNPDGLKDLVAHVRAEGADATLSLPDSLPKTVAMVANAPGTFNSDALKHFDSLDALVFRFSDDDPTAPLMSGMGSLVPGEPARVRLTPLLCTIIIAGVTNYYEGDTLAENPRVWMENINGEAGIFKQYGFAVKDPSSSRAVYLPCDIGLYTQYPGTRLFCYPNDLPDPNPGNPATTLFMQYEIEGETQTLSLALHPISRGETIPVELALRPYGAGRP